jgi:hypothetical protein
MNNIDKLIKETLNSKLNKLLTESDENVFTQSFKNFDSVFNEYIESLKVKFTTIKNKIEQVNSILLKFGFNYTIESSNKNKDVLRIFYIINDSYNWGEDEIEKVDDYFYSIFTTDKQEELYDDYGIEVSFIDSINNGYGCYFELTCDLDNIKNI